MSIWYDIINYPQEQKDELKDWLDTNEGKKAKKYLFSSKKSNYDDKDNKRKADGSAGGNWSKKTRKALNTKKGLKSVIAILAEGENSNQWFVSALSIFPLPPAPANTTPTPPVQVASVQYCPKWHINYNIVQNDM